MKRKQNRLTVPVLVLILVLSLSIQVFAHDVPDLDRLGSITMTVKKGGTPVPGGSLTVYRVAEVAEDDGNYFFNPAGKFAACGESFAKLDAAPEMAQRLFDYVIAQSVNGDKTVEIDSHGVAVFEKLPVGLYLVVQHKAAPGYAALAPFLVSLPYLEDGEYRYDLASFPKPGLEQEPKPTDPPPTRPSDPTLPQTGQMNWPVPVLAVLGMAFFTAGWILFRDKRKQNEA